MITIFTPSFADETDTNAQNLTVKEVVARLAPERFRVVMLYEQAPDPRIANRPNTELVRWRKRGNTLRILWRCLRNLPDVYFFPREGPLDAAFLTLRRRLGLKTRVVSYIVSGGLYSNEAPRRTLVRNAVEADLVFGNSAYLSALLRERLGLKAGIRYDAVDRRFFFPPGPRDSPANAGTVLFAGSLRPYKHAELVVRQAARWPQVRFRILGRGEEESNCRRLASELGCSNVVFAGHLSPAEVGSEMRKADIFFFPSAIEGHPQVLLQAAACALPCIARNVYKPEYVVHEKTGFLVDSDGELAAKLDILIQQPDLRRIMGELAAIHVQQYDWDSVTRQWEQAFEGVVARPKK